MDGMDRLMDALTVMPVHFSSQLLFRHRPVRTPVQVVVPPVIRWKNEFRRRIVRAGGRLPRLFRFCRNPLQVGQFPRETVTDSSEAADGRRVSQAVAPSYRLINGCKALP